uniref:DUF3741 domain-containing protein n=1 Tax=Cajanus cajan TaxID=3821 RepID=A0A151RDD4_CAJCA|nr:hypothetical protein KK1_037986 [Cajanus cajan]
MNLLTPSSSSTLTLDPSKGATAGYLTTIFRRILCSGGLPTHPLDQISERDSKSKMSGKVQEFKPKQSTQSTTTSTITPGIVERLMGLEPMGERETKTSIEATPSSSLSRSKSMNSVVEHLGECKRMEGLHKHAKSSSFHEVSTFYLHENENFLVLSFKSGCDDGVEFRSKGRKKEKGLKERALFMGLFEKENVDSETKRFSHSMKSKEVTNGAKVKRRKKGTTCYAEKKVDTECNSEEDSSPVSIFDFERQTPRTDTSWRRKLSSELENEQLYCDNNMVNEEMKVNTIENNKHEGSKRKEKQSHECADIWVEICRLVDDELGSNKFDEGLRKQGNFESVCVDFESEIFDHLLYEVIDQLVGKAL